MNTKQINQLTEDGALCDPYSAMNLAQAIDEMSDELVRTACKLFLNGNDSAAWFLLRSEAMDYWKERASFIAAQKIIA